MSAFNAGSIVGRLILDSSGFTQGVAQANAATAILGPTLTAFLTNPLLGVVSVAKEAAAAMFGMFTGVVGNGLALAADYEQAQIAFEVMLGSADQAKTVLGDIQKFAASTPFQFPELVDAGRKLLAFGTAGDQIVPTLRMIGDVASGVGQPIGQIAEIYGKAQVQGRLFAEDVNQLTGRGIPIIGELAKQFGVAESQVRGLVEKGAVGFPQLAAAFVSLTSEGGRFFGMTERQAGSTSGLWGTLIDGANQASQKLSEGLSKGLDIKGVIATAIGYFDQFMPTIEAVGVRIGSFLGGQVGFLKEQFMHVLPSLNALGGALLNAFGIALPGRRQHGAGARHRPPRPRGVHHAHRDPDALHAGRRVPGDR